MKWTIIATWPMAETGITIGAKELNQGADAIKAALACVKDVEKNPAFTSVGYGGLPNKDGQVELDASVMDGNTLSFGAVGGIKAILHPCEVAYLLSQHDFNNFLVGQGANEYAKSNGFETVNLNTASSERAWKKHKAEVEEGLSPYNGHDTVCCLALDSKGKIGVVTSTSGLFYKAPGRLGDSPLPGAGYYADSDVGGAAATGLGEDIAKGAISYEIVRLMAEGRTPQEACDHAVFTLNNRLVKKRGKSGDISVIALNKDGQVGASSNIGEFSFVMASSENQISVNNVKNVTK